MFNGRRVPPATELDGQTLDAAIAEGNWLVEFFSPYCGHCIAFAPTWQTNYEYYYTSDPTPKIPGASGSSFTSFYNFRFAKVDCAANSDICAKNGISSFPTMKFIQDGKVEETQTGGKDMAGMSKWVEALLEKIKPGTRLAEPPKAPKVGAKSVDGYIPPTAALAEPTELALAAGYKTKTMLKATKLAPHVPATPNPDGKSIPLTAENFQRVVTNTRESWFIKFYAPWCHHCQALAPNWQGMARQMQDQLNVGEVNCDVEKRLCKDVKVRGYPTMLFFRGGERLEYDGLRGLGDLISFANKAKLVDAGVVDVDAKAFEAMEEKEEVIFLYFYDHATTSEDFLALDRLVIHVVAHAKLVKTKDPVLAERFKITTWPRMVVSRDGKASYYTGLSPRDMRDTGSVLHWMQSVWLPIVPELTASNAREIMHGKLVVLGILSRDRPEEFVVAKREIKNAALEWIDKQTQAFKLERQELRDAKQLRIEEAEDRNDQRALRSAKSIRINMDEIDRKEVGFAWVDAVFWERWVRTTFGISVVDGEKVVVNDEDNHRYWDVTATGNPIVPSRTSILETLARIVANPPKLSPKRTTTTLGHVWWVIKAQLFEHPRVSIGVALAVIAGVVFYGRQHVRMFGGGYIRLGEKGGLDGLLGGNSGSRQGKVD